MRQKTKSKQIERFMRNYNGHKKNNIKSAIGG